MVRHEPPGGQIAEGRNINQAGRDYIENIGLIVDPFDLQLKFDKIDKEISGAIGDPVSPTADGAVIKYSSEKLFTSLIHVGLSPINAFGLIQDVGRYITDEIQLDKSRFSTAHIRKAVSNAILESPKLQMSRSDRRSQANKYARNYGNPLQITMVVYSNGDSTPIRYEYIMKTLLPNIIGKYTNNVKVFRFHGNDPDNFGIDQKGVLSINNLSHMAQELLNSVRRLGVYQIRYQTLFAIGEELALQLPHPWIVSSQSRIDTVLHDIERARNHFENIKNREKFDLRFWRVANECFNHICSHILASYGSVIGGGDNAAPNTLRNFTRMAVSGDKENIALWEFCSISELEDDIKEIGWTIGKFHAKVKLLQKVFQRMREDDAGDTVDCLRELLDICETIHHIKN